MGVGDEPVGDGIGDASAAEILVPVASRQLRGEYGGGTGSAVRIKISLRDFQAGRSGPQQAE